MSLPAARSALQLILALSLCNVAQAADLEGTVRKTEAEAEVNGTGNGSKLKGLTGTGEASKLSGTAESNGSTRLTGSTNSPSLSGQANKPGIILQGSLKDDALLRPSLKILPGGTADGYRNSTFSGDAKSNLFPLGTGVVQYAGGTQYAPGQPAPKLSPLVPSSTGQRFTGLIPPISSYSLNPRTSTMWVAPGYAVTPGLSTKAATTVAPGSDSYSPTTQKGVTSWIQGYQVSKSTRLWDKPPGGHGGVITWAPGYVDVTSILKTSTTGRTGTGITRSGVTTYTPGYQVNVSTSRGGVVCWTPGYEVTVEVPGMTKSSLGGTWSASKLPSELIASQGSLKVREFAQIVPLPSPPALMATPLLMPQLQAKAADANLTWAEWYQSVATAIYDRWKHAEVGPGLAKVRVTVTAARDLSCQIVDFYPAPDIDRNVTAETAFREAALRVVNSVNRFEIPELPETPLPSDKKEKGVSFDVDLKRTVDGPAGIDVATASTRGKAEGSR